MIESFVRKFARGVVTACVVGLPLAACGAVADERGSASDAGAEATVVTGVQPFECIGDEGPNELGVSIVRWIASDVKYYAPGATLRWTNCSAPILTFSDGRAQARMQFGHPELHAPIVEGPGLLPTVGGHLPAVDPADPSYEPGVSFFAPALDAATFAPTVPLRDDAATIVVLYATQHADDPTCGSFEGLETSIAEHPELVASSHFLFHDTAANAAGRYDVFEGLPPGETIHVLTTFPKCSVIGTFWDPPPLLEAHAQLLQRTVGPVGL